MSLQIILHGGAKEIVEEADDRKKICNHIVENIAVDLRKGANALDACEKAVNLLEDEPIFNAGTGSYIQTDGKIRMESIRRLNTMLLEYT